MSYNREPVLPIHVKHNLDREQESEIEDENHEPFDLYYFDVVFKSATKVRTLIKDDAAENVKAAQIRMIVDICLIHKLGLMTWC